MFGRRKREEAAAAEAAREAERRALFAKLAQRPEHICPFLGLADDRTGYVDGVSDEHRCFAFGDPAPLSAEQQTRVCQERGYGNCPRYLRGVLVIPTEELEALRRPHAPIPPPPPPNPEAAQNRRRRGGVLALLLGLLVLVGGGAAFMLLNDDGDGVSLPTASPSPTPAPTVSVAPSVEPTAGPTTEPTSSAQPTPTPEPTPEAGDTFAFYEVSVGPNEYTLYNLDADGVVSDSLVTSFSAFSFAQVEPTEGSDGDVHWVTVDGALAGWSYTYPDSGDFRIRAVFLSSSGERRSAYLEEQELTVVPEATPAPAP
ncbi:MAG TPA: hypothetical protein VHQ42_01515 [Candidatus Limnocylindria bacterium]|nr:hypothetical protein [Candidatus Limnocylindria bacterium]